MASIPASWSDLPLDLLGLVVANLPKPADRARSRAVCRSWHSAVRRHGHQLPWIFRSDAEVSTLSDGRSHRMPSVPDGTTCVGSSDDWLALGFFHVGKEFYIIDSYLLHNGFSNTSIPLPELDFIIQEDKRIRKLRVRSTADGLVIAVITTSQKHPFVVIKPGKGVWLPEQGAEPYVYIIDIAFLGDTMYAITRAQDLVPLYLTSDADGRPMVTMGRRVIRQPSDHYGYDEWPASDDEEAAGADLDDNDGAEQEEEDAGVDDGDSHAEQEEGAASVHNHNGDAEQVEEVFGVDEHHEDIEHEAAGVDDNDDDAKQEEKGAGVEDNRGDVVHEVESSDIDNNDDDGGQKEEAASVDDHDDDAYQEEHASVDGDDEAQQEGAAALSDDDAEQEGEEGDEEEEGSDANDEDGNDDLNSINYLNCSHDFTSDDEIIYRHLVESSGKLLMLRPHIRILPADFSVISICKVDVFEADMDTHTWVPMVNGLGGGRALFMGLDFSKSVSAPQGEVEEDAIYFIQSGEVFDMKTQTHRPQRFCEPTRWGQCGDLLFPPELVI